MLGATITGAVYGAFLQAPEVIGYCSSLTRGTPFVQESYSRSHLDGFERSRHFSKLRLKLTDVESDSDVGLLLVSDDTEDRCSLRKGRLYQ